MAGTKRSWEGRELRISDSPAQSAMASTTDSATQIQSIFSTFRDELDQHHDRRERVIKTSRDITALSKKIIFSLQRVRTIHASIPPSITKETSSRFAQITDLFRAVIPDVTGVNRWRYQRQLSGAIQEFIEALSFHHYLEHQRLITRAEVAAHLPEEILVTEEDYLLGLFDLTGEMMRFAVTALSGGGQKGDNDKGKETEGNAHEDGSSSHGPRLQDSQAGLVVDLREMRSLFEALSVPRRHNMLRDMGKKVDVMQSSVEKVERAAYGILVRGSERPAGWRPDLSVAETEY